ncbi:hypothetical protein M427DRAFT_74175 [Gonapodya prolifera JEL478]|uniref:Uncharacterized protein n=1 Tax=Gonapodya prolifera (strain JEL478) TaxID=1344416 RepID=A0A139A0Z3_GONPJ|nr:hypothetical protein M427DRAFT_74175 [Gonapodya prolifera JEL478]|eukprot:KXS10394.1 hypothetical protein M427DRAFT_74175 [Gonapodya prolifera JEL478]
MRAGHLAVFVALLVSAVVVVGGDAANILYQYQCDRQSGFIFDSYTHNRFGYVHSFSGLNSDVSIAYNRPTPSGAGCDPSIMSAQARGVVVGVIETFTWAGGPTDGIDIVFWVSWQSATALKASQQSQTNLPSQITFSASVIDYDLASQQWFYDFCPAATLQGTISRLDVSLQPEPISYGIDVNIYKVAMTVLPPKNYKFVLRLASSPSNKLNKAWGSIGGGSY